MLPGTESGSRFAGTKKGLDAWLHLTLCFIGPGEMIRTSDPHNPIVVRYQAALRPEFSAPVLRDRSRNTRRYVLWCQSCSANA